MNWRLLKDIRHQLWKTFVEKSLGQAVIFSNGLLVSNKLGLNAVAAVGVSNMVLLTFSILTSSLTSVTNTEVGKTLGEEKATGTTHSKKGVVVVQGFYLVGTLSFLLSAVAIVFAPQLLAASGADHATVEQGTPYLRILGGLYLFEGLRILAAAALQGMKDFKSPLKASYWMNGLHIVLAILAIYLLDLGLVGVAWATLISQMVGLLYLLLPLYQQAFLKKKDDEAVQFIRFKLSFFELGLAGIAWVSVISRMINLMPMIPTHFRRIPKVIPWKLEWTMLKSMFILSKDTMIQGIWTRASLVIYGSVLLYDSNEAFVAQRIHGDVIHFTFVLMDAFIAVMAPLVSTLYGERTAMHDQLHDTLLSQEKNGLKDQEHIQELVENRKKKDQELVSMVNGFLGLTCLFMGLLAVLQYVAWEWITGLYTNDPTTIQVSHKMSLVALFWLVPFTCYCVMYKGGLAPVKDRKGSRNSVIIATLLWIAALWVVKDWGLDAILISRILFDFLRGALVAGRFYSKKWTQCPSSICGSHS